jgi:hypothetical protein
VIGVDMKENHPLATRVHSYRKANDPESLVKAVTSALSEVSTSGAQDTAGQEEFELVAAFPPEMAKAAIEALTASGNHAIGEAPPRAGAQTFEERAASQPGDQAVPVPPGGGGFGFVALVFLAVMFALIFLGRAAAGRGSR